MNRIQTLIFELKYDWDELNLSAKFLVIIGIFLLATIIYFAISPNKDLAVANKIELIFKTSFASVFGFLLSSNIKNHSKNNDIKVFLQRKSDDKCDEICKREKKYDYGNGNSVQIFIALITTILSGLTILIIYINTIPVTEVVISQFRDLMCTAIGFLLGESKIRTD